MGEQESTTTALGPGVYSELPAQRYHLEDAASNSRLSRLMRSPAHLRAYLQEPPAETAALVLGRAVHAATLEPETAWTKYVKGPDGDRRTKRVREVWDALEDVHGIGYVLRPTDYDMCERVRDSVHGCTVAHRLISGPGEVELSVLWEDPATEVLCKARWDRHSPEIAGGAIVDLKTTRDASPRSFERAILDYGYHRQAAMYLMGARVRRLPARHYSIIAVEKTPPYAVAVYRITEGVVDAAREQIEALLALYRRCRERDEWPGYPDEVRDISVPSWAWGVMDEQTAAIREVAEVAA